MSSHDRTARGPGAIATFLLVLVTHALTTFGRVLTSVDTDLYVQLADGMLRGDFSATLDSGSVRWTKSVYLVLLALARVTAGRWWPVVMLALNLACSAIAAVLVIDLAKRVTSSSAAAWTAVVLYASCFEIFFWTRFVTTDSLFLLTSFVPFYLVARRLVDPAEPPRVALLAAFVLIGALSRPPGFLLLPFVLFVELVLVRKRISWRAAATLFGVTAIAAVIARCVIVHDPALWPFAFVRGKLTAFSQLEQGGKVILGLQQSWFGPPRSVLGHVVMVVERFVRFFQPVAPWYSLRHNLANACYFLMLYGFSALAIARWRDASRAAQRLMVAIAAWTVLYAGVHALTILDAHWRYRSPLMPHLVLFAAIGASHLWKSPSRESFGQRLLSRCRRTIAVVRSARSAS